MSWSVFYLGRIIQYLSRIGCILLKYLVKSICSLAYSHSVIRFCVKWQISWAVFFNIFYKAVFYQNILWNHFASTCLLSLRFLCEINFGQTAWAVFFKIFREINLHALAFCHTVWKITIKRDEVTKELISRIFFELDRVLKYFSILLVTEFLCEFDVGQISWAA